MGVAKLHLPAEKLAGLAERKEFYTTGEVAQLFGVTAKTVVNWCNSRRLACIVTAAGHRRIPASAFAGGPEYDARLMQYQAMMAAMLEGHAPPSGEEIAAQVRERR